MALGKQQLVIGQEDFLRGMSSSPEVADRGFSDETVNVNPIIKPGLIYPAANTLDSGGSSVLTDEIIASCPDHQTSGIEEREVVTEDGKYYRYNGTALGSVLDDDSGDAAQYIKGTTDMVVYRGETYISKRDDLRRWTGASTFDGGGSWPHTLTGGRPHPLLVFENNLYVGNGNDLQRMTAVGDSTNPVDILVLEESEVIYALGIDRGTGQILIATKNIIDFSNTLTAIHKLHWYDGFSDKVRKVVEVDDMICAFYNIGNTTFVGYGRNLGFINGSGIQFLRKFKNVTNDLDLLPYKQNFTNIGNTLYVVDGDLILAYGEVISGGPKVFYYPYENDITASENFKAIFFAGRGASSDTDKLGLSSPKGVFDESLSFHTLDVTSLADLSGGLTLTSNWYQFPRPVHITHLYAEFADAVTTSNLTFSYKISDAAGFRSLNVENGTLTSVFEVPAVVGFINKITSIKFRIIISVANVGLRKLIIYYDFIE